MSVTAALLRVQYKVTAATVLVLVQYGQGLDPWYRYGQSIRVTNYRYSYGHILWQALAAKLIL